MRQKARTQSSYLFSKYPNKDVSLEELQRYICEGNDEELVGRISRAAEFLRGTRPYWHSQSCDLEAIVRQLNSPHLFVTWSAADIQWDDLHRHLPKYTEPLDFVSDPNRHQIASHHMIKHPHIVAEYLVRRVSFCMKHIVKNLFKVADFWYRFEWQSRGSGHVHGFICLEDQPPPSTKTEKSREELAKYWASMVSAINPHQSLPQLGVNPASLPILEQKNTLRDLTECLNRFSVTSIVLLLTV